MLLIPHDLVLDMASFLIDGQCLSGNTKWCSEEVCIMLGSPYNLRGFANDPL